MNITIFNENYHEIHHPEVKTVYPKGIHGTLADILAPLGGDIRIATQDMPECGLTDEVLNSTDVLLWWGHMKHHEVPDELVSKVHARVLSGMGIMVLHSGHFSKIFKKLTGTACSLGVSGDVHMKLHCTAPSHPIAAGVPLSFDVGLDEVYAEPFDIPEPDELVYIGWFENGSVFRSGCCYKRGYGRMFYFSPGHETDPSYHNEHIGTIIRNAALWLKPTAVRGSLDCFNV